VRRLSLLVGLAAGIGATLHARRRREARRERVDLYYSDGSMVSLDTAVPDGDRLLGLAREALAAARP
jgi:hypothetical protein